MQGTHDEIEAKLYVPDLAAVQKRLEAAGGLLVSPRLYEYNVRYNDPGGRLLREGIVLRLRRDARVRLTYKSPGQAHAGLISRQESEVEVADFDTMHSILLQLGYTPYMIYEKYRTTYTLDDTEIVLDEMPYGPFVEVEGRPQDIELVLEKLELARFPRYTASYAVLFTWVCQHLGLELRDLTFENFAGIHVPEGAFQPPAL